MFSKSTRNNEMVRLYAEGATFAALARQYELSPSRVAQIVARTRRTRKTLAIRLAAPLRLTT